MIGQTLGPYTIVSKLGEGGMGAVYRAHDAKLNRDVAIKVLPELFSHDPDRLARFRREAQVLASLNHPHIGHVYGLEDSAGVHALVMELVEGEDLSAVIARGPLSIADTVAIARQIIDALETAHDQGIVHRDLKPANIKVRGDGTVKVLDFGLAKAIEPATASGVNVANSPTLTAHATQMGMILGTAAYMAPEQARGKAVDRRADIWAFGAVLFEMLTGRRAFEGDEVSDVLATVLKSDPDWTALPAQTPASIRRLLRRCLEKDPRKRLSAIGDARFDLDDISAPAATPLAAAAPVPAAKRSFLSIAGAAGVGIVMTAAVAGVLWPRGETVGGAPLTRLSILAPTGDALYPDSASVAISPDGTMVAFVVGAVSRSHTQLWIRTLDSTTARHLEGGDDGQLPFWSPDGRRLGFFTNDKLKTVSVAGGRADVLCDAPGGRGAVWTPSNAIIAALDAGGPLYRVPASGGKPVPLTTLDAARLEYGHRFPALLPDGDHFLFAALPGKNGQFDIFASSLKDPSKRTLVGSMEAAPVYAEPGYLLWARQGLLMAQVFDAATLKLNGDPVSLDDEPSSILDPNISYTAGVSTSASKTGALAYFAAPSENMSADWYDALGRKTGNLAVPPGHYERLAISPDGLHAVFVKSLSPSESSLWIVDLSRGGATPLSSGRGRNDSPVWSPDGTRVVFSSDRDGPMNFFVKMVGDASPEQPLYQSDVPFKAPSTWTGDGKWLAVTQLDRGSAQNIWLLPMPGGGDLKPYYAGPTRDAAGTTSPDGKWLWYSSDETGRFELYVQPFPTPGRKVKVSQNGGVGGWWTRDQRQLFFLGDDLRTLWRADVRPGPVFEASVPVQLATFPPNIVYLDAMPDRQKFLGLSPERTGPGSVTVVLNWRAALAKKR